MTKQARHYRLTTLGCFAGIFSQAIITNLTAILFIPLMKLYGFSYVDLGIMVGVNFLTQISADLIFSGMIDHIGFRRIVLPSCAFAALGLLLFAATPMLFPAHIFAGFLGSTVIFSFSSGLLEVTLSPIVDAIPNEDKGGAMSLMHSFYAWGQAATIILTTLALHFIGAGRWQVIPLFWAVIPLTAFTLFASCDMPANSEKHLRARKRDLMRSPFFLISLAAILLGGATEVCMNQWASTFMNAALGIPKITGDLAAMCGFALMLGLGRLLYGLLGARLNLNRVLIFCSAGAAVCYGVVALSPVNGINMLACALAGFFSALLWPGVIVIASEYYPAAGSFLFAILAMAGDIGAGGGPYLTGAITEYAGRWRLSELFMRVYRTELSSTTMRLGILITAVFPILAFLCHILLSRLKTQTKEAGAEIRAAE